MKVKFLLFCLVFILASCKKDTVPYENLFEVNLDGTDYSGGSEAGYQTSFYTNVKSFISVTGTLDSTLDKVTFNFPQATFKDTYKKNREFTHNSGDLIKQVQVEFVEFSTGKSYYSNSEEGSAWVRVIRADEERGLEAEFTFEAIYLNNFAGNDTVRGTSGHFSLPF